MNCKPITIITAELPHLDFDSNYSRTTELRNAMLNLGLSFVGVIEVKDGSKFQSFVITNGTTKEILELATKFGQESVLFSDNQRLTTELFTNGKDSISMGELEIVDKSYAVVQNWYITVREEGQEFFYTTKGN